MLYAVILQLLLNASITYCSGSQAAAACAQGRRGLPIKILINKVDQIWEDLGADQSSLLLYCGSRRLSLGHVMSHIFASYHEPYGFLKKEEHEAAELFVDSDFLIKLAYLVDILEKLNILKLIII